MPTDTSLSSYDVRILAVEGDYRLTLWAERVIAPVEADRVSHRAPAPPAHTGQGE